MGKIRLSKSIVGEKEADAVRQVLIDDGYLGMGKYVQQFEEKLKQYLSTDHEVICVNSGTAALHLGLLGLNLNPGDEVLVQSLTYVATFQAITAAGLKPIACEIVPETLTIDLVDAERKITARTRVILPVHYSGRVVNLESIYQFAAKHELRVVEDAAHAFGTVYQEKKMGSFGDIICFSFDGIKSITSGEGGALITNDQLVAGFAKDARLLAVKKDTEKRFSGERSWEFDVTHQGYRYHMSNIFAAIGLCQLERFETEFKPKRQNLARRYNELLKNIAQISLFHDNYIETVPHIFPIRILNGQRDELKRFLLEKNIESGIHYHPNHLLTYFSYGEASLPITEKIFSELLTLPLHPEITELDQFYIVDQIKSFF